VASGAAVGDGIAAVVEVGVGVSVGEEVTVGWAAVVAGDCRVGCSTGGEVAGVSPPPQAARANNTNTDKTNGIERVIADLVILTFQQNYAGHNP
jgi:acyl-[acyl carrier protein]--UDP-N-acetylglucosamine O-acyltransferase